MLSFKSNGYSFTKQYLENNLQNILITNLRKVHHHAFERRICKNIIEFYRRKEKFCPPVASKSNFCIKSNTFDRNDQIFTVLDKFDANDELLR